MPPHPPTPAGPKLDSVFLVFEYCPHDMGKLVDSLSKPFHESEVKGLMQQVGMLCCCTWLPRLGEGTVEPVPCGSMRREVQRLM